MRPRGESELSCRARAPDALAAHLILFWPHCIEDGFAVCALNTRYLNDR
jgi:hypothetical protein